MKKFLALLVAAMLTFAFAACNNRKNGSNTEDGKNIAADTNTEE